MENESMRDERQELAGSQADVPEKELNRRNLESAPEQEQPTFDVDEADLVVPQPEEPAPDPAEFTDADVKAVREETVVEGKPVEVENWRPETAYPEEPTAAERMANNAREQATAAADAFRRGELMRDASVDPAADSDDRLIALLSYATQILIPFVMPALVLLSESSKKRPFQRFHAVQSIALVAVLVVLAIFVAIGTVIIGFVPIIGWAIAAVVGCLTPIAVLMVWFALVYYGYQAYQGKRFAIPGLTSFLKDQGWV